MTAPEPRLDAFATDRVGTPLEDLSRITAAQPYRSDGPVVDRSALEELLGGARRVGESRRDTLVAAGLITARGKPTGDGERLAGVRRTARVALRVYAEAAGRESNLDVFVSDAGTLLLAGNPAYLLPDPQAELRPGPEVQLALIDLLAMPLALVSWLGLAPAWQFAVTPEVVPASVVQARTADPATPAPPDADEPMLRMWAQPWLRWAIGSAPIERKLSVLSAGAAGNFVLGAASGGEQLVLHSAPAGQVWRDLLQLIAQSLGE